ncbi:MAG: phosphopantetheine-binding protein [Acidimicrobiales bacterium]
MAPSTDDRPRIELVPVSLVPVTALYQVAYMSGAASTWRTRGRTTDLDRFASYINDGGEAAFAVIDHDRSGSVVGYTGLYNVDPVSLVAYVSVFFDARLPDASYVGGTAIHLFTTYVFSVLGLRKLMIESPASRSTYLDDALRWTDVATREGTLKAHARLGQTYEDIHVYAVWADRYLARHRGPKAPSTDIDLAAVADMVAEITGTAVPHLTGGHQLVEDLGLDSLALLELVDMIEARTNRRIALGADDPLTVQSLLLAIEDMQAQHHPGTDR